jgi:hypothetical protein
MRHPPDPARGEPRVWYAIHECFYRDDEVDDLTVDSSEVGYTQDPITPRADEVDELREVLREMLAALDKPVLDYRDSPDAEPGAAADRGRM